MTARSRLHNQVPYNSERSLQQFRNAVGAVSDLIRAVIDRPYNKSFGMQAPTPALLPTPNPTPTPIPTPPVGAVYDRPNPSILRDENP